MTLPTDAERGEERDACVPRYMTVPEASDYLRISPSYLRKATRAGDVACARLGQRVIYDRQELDAWVARRTVRRHSARWGDGA